ncbi:MAG: preprotein translocase subunit SecY [Bacteroidia bacterium]|nr:preprotein translocase subunit SecY [Bacteroidia bacterium]MDW8159371.1 preprotein translocase subunit SecY [Bacteroidia bacterium]
MERFISNLQNTFKIPELKKRILYTVFLLIIFRVGSYVILPGIDSTTLQNLFANKQGGGVLDLLNTFVGGAFSRGSIFALGIMPYISASIIIQLLATALPNFQKLQREGESGTRKLNQYTRYLTILITMVQAAGYVVNLQTQYQQALMMPSTMFWLTTVFVLTAGTLFLVWLGERITDNGIGNGVSLLIAVGILADLIPSLVTEAQSVPAMFFYAELIALGIVTLGVILFTTGTRRIPVNYARRMVGVRTAGGVITNNTRQFIPLKINSAGVMPIIFAQALMFLPATLLNFFPDSETWLVVSSVFNNYTSVGYNILFAALIIVFTYFYTAVAVNPNDIAEQLRKNGGFVPGIKPGKDTSDHIDDVLTKITLPGAIFLAAVAIMPAIAARLGVSSQFAQFFGGTSLLIMIGVVLETIQQIESYLLMRHYDGLMKTGRVKSKSTVSATS